MKRLIQLIIIGLAVLYVQSHALTVRTLNLEGVVQQSEVIAIVSIYRGDATVGHDPDELFDLAEFCSKVESTLLDEVGVADAASLCFRSGYPLKVGATYLLFLSKDDYEQSTPKRYLALLALEVVGPNPHHDFQAIRWEALRHPILPGLVEETAMVDYYDEGTEQGQRSIPVYTYFPLSDIEHIVREYVVEDERPTGPGHPQN